MDTESGESLTQGDKQNEEPVASAARLGVGKFIWLYDENHRVYAKGDSGRPMGAPIYREHWVKTEITGETSRSWLVGQWQKKKVPKKGGRGIAFTEQEVDDDVWVYDHRYKLSRLIGDCKDAGLLRAVAKVIGYDV